MSVRLRAAVSVAASPAAVWAELTDWEGQARWIPATTIAVLSAARAGPGVAVRAQHGVMLAGVRRGLVDHFVTTGWAEEREIEVLHTGPVFTGVGVFALVPEPTGHTRFTVTEDFELPWPLLGRVAEAGAILARPLLEAGLSQSLARFARIVGASR